MNIETACGIILVAIVIFFMSTIYNTFSFSNVTKIQIDKDYENYIASVSSSSATDEKSPNDARTDSSSAPKNLPNDAEKNNTTYNT